jgi:5-(carboxyamino)imidazole ribonucleotide synthase
VVETVQRDHVCREVVAPAGIAPQVAERAEALARRAVAAVGGIGSFGVELFLGADGALAINELAPRVHNSGHYTIEACACSQFENHVRAVLGWPLGSPVLVRPAAAMVNLIGERDGPGRVAGLPRALAQHLAHRTLAGTAALLHEQDLHPGQLKDMVSSPGGTTIAGLRRLEAGGVRSALLEAVLAAAERSRELG